LTPLGSGIFLGLALGFAAHWLIDRTLHRPTPTPAGAPKQDSARVTPIAVFLIASLLGMQLRALAQDAADNGRNPTFGVLIPSDTEPETRDKHVYVPEPLYKELIRRTSQRSHDRGHWLITQARYESPSPENAAPSGRVWTAHFLIETFSNAQVRLPLGQSGANLVPQGATLDDKPLQFEWDERLKVMVVDLPRPGKYKIAVEFIPTRRDGGVPSYDFSIPAVPDSRLDVHSLPGISRPDVSAFGMITPQDDSGLRCEIGPSDRITLRNSQAGAEATPAEFQATEMYWLRAAPGALMLEGRFQLTVDRGIVKHVVLQLDPSVHLLPPDETSNIAAVKWQNDGRSVRLVFREPVDESTSFDLSFVLQPPSMPARLAWPRIALAGPKQTRRILAASSTPDIELQPSPITGAKTLSTAEFALLWPAQSIRPRLVFEVPTTPGDWELQIAPRPSKISATYQTRVAARRTEAQMNWLADIQITGEPRLEFKIHAPLSLWVDDVHVTDAANPRPSRWVRDRAGQITVVLDSPLVGEAQVHLAGSLPLDAVGRVVIANPTIQDAQAERQTLFLTRALNALITPGDATGLQELPLAEAADLWSHARPEFPVNDHDRFVAAFTAIEPRSSIHLRIAPNRPQLEVVQVTTVERLDTGWTATLDAEISTAGGTLDELRIGLPDNWQGPFSIDPPIPSQIVDSPDGVRVLIVQPSAPLTETTRLRIRAPLLSTNTQPLRAPKLHFDGANPVREYVVLPVEFNLQQLAWETRDLTEETLPEPFNQGPAPTGFKTYRASHNAAAELKSIEKLAENAHITLADIVLAWHADQSCYGIATFDLDPAGAESCLLALPTDFELIDAAIDRLPQPRQVVANQRWRLSLGRARLPVRIEVVFRGLVPRDSRDVPHEALAPWLVGLPVEQTLWTIAGPPWAGLPTVNYQKSLAPADIEIARLKSTVALMNTAGSTLVDGPTQDIARWYRPWLDRWRQTRESLQRLAAMSHSGDASTAAAETLSRADADQVQLARRLGVWSAVEPIWNEPIPQDSSSQTWQQSLGRHNPSAHYRLDGAATAPVLDYPRAFAGDWGSRVAQAAVACVIILLIGWAIRSTRLSDVIARWPQAAVIVLGLLWWLLLSPSAVGWIIVALGAFGPRIDRAIGRLAKRFALKPTGKTQ
jgi:hypothetical protein